MAMPEDAALTYFTLDAEDHIVEVGGNWDHMAQANGGEAVLARKVTGTWLFDHISGDVSRMYVRAILDGVRLLGRPVTRPYRCDSPRLKRHMEMAIAPEPDHGLRIEHRLLRTEPLVPILNFIAAGPGHGRPRVRCSMCNRLRVGGTWHEPDAAVTSADVEAAAAEGIPVVHGVCASCLQAIRGNPAPIATNRD